MQMNFYTIICSMPNKQHTIWSWLWNFMEVVEIFTQKIGKYDTFSAKINDVYLYKAVTGLCFVYAGWHAIC